MMKNKPTPPCKDCKLRTREDPEKHTRDCHDRCKKYLAFKKENAMYRSRIREEHAADYITHFKVEEYK